MSYTLKYKRKFFWETIKNVIGHNLDSTEHDRYVIYKKDEILTIPKWSECSLKLGSDFMLFQKNEMEKEANQDIKLKG